MKAAGRHVCIGLGFVAGLLLEALGGLAGLSTGGLLLDPVPAQALLVPPGLVLQRGRGRWTAPRGRRGTVQP